jgi:hypothetical protein
MRLVLPARPWPATVILLLLASAAAADGPAPQVLTLAEAAALLRVEPAALAEAAGRGEVPGRRILSEWRFERTALLRWLGADPAPAAPVAVPASAPRPSPPAPRPAPDAGSPAVAAPAPAATPEITPPGPAADEPAGELAYGEAPELETARDVALRDQAVLLRGGQLSLESALSYARTDSQLGLQKQETLAASVALRYGLVDDLQTIVTLPALLRSRETITDVFDPAQIDERTRTSFGAVNLGLRYGA